MNKSHFLFALVLSGWCSYQISFAQSDHINHSIVPEARHSFTAENIPFQIVDWRELPTIRHEGTSGTLCWQELNANGLRARIAYFSDEFSVDEWCEKGHLVYCLEGEFEMELKDGLKFKIGPGMSFIVSDNIDHHKLSSRKGVKMMILDGDFLKPAKN